jgi:adenine-specific DNA-methyltransferase
MKVEPVTNNIKVTNNDLETLKIHFPQCFDKDGNFQLEKFKNNLTEKEINFSTESYGLDWLGKSYARLLASDPATTLLKADEAHNALPENANSENLLIKGDNLEVLKHLANAYYEQVKMIYIDPPYNTGSDGFVYNDDRKFTVRELQNLIGVDAEKAKRILDFTKQESNSHSAWLTFLYPRLYIAKQLLKDEGVIFVSIDDNEVAQLRLLMDEVFGEENYIETFVWINNQRGRSTDKHISNTYENIFMYGKNIDKCLLFDELENDEDKLSDYNLKDEFSYYKRGDNLFNNNSQFNIETRPNLVYSIYVNKNTNNWICVDEKYKNEQNQLVLPVENKMGDEYIKVVPPLRHTNNKMGCWRWSIEKFNAEAKNELILEEKSDGTFMFYTKNRLDDDGNKWNKHKNVIQNITSTSGTNELVHIFKDKIFSSPKPTRLIIKLASIALGSKDIILDFFAGSGTTGDAVMQLNAEDGGNRKFILVQWAEEIDPKKNKTAYDFVKNELNAEPTIFEITKERLLRAAKKINADLDEKIKKLKSEIQTEETKAEITKYLALKTQNSFKIFETTPIWEDYNFEAEQFDSSQTLFDAGKLTEDDIRALLTTWKTYDGIALTQELESIDLSGYTSYYGNGRLYLMHKGFTTDSLKTLLEKIDTDKHFEIKTIIAFGYHFESARMREISENVRTYNNKKKSDIDFITRY